MSSRPGRNAAGFVEILHASLRGAGCRWNAPEWLATGSGADMAAYTASLTAQAPFVRTAMQKQLSYKKAFTRVIKQAIATAVDFGRLLEEVFEALDIQCEAPSIPYKSALDEAQANQIRVQGGWKSRQTVQQEEGLDPEREMQNIEEYNRRMGAIDKQGQASVQEANFNPDEPRDERGRWNDADGKDTAQAMQDYYAKVQKSAKELAEAQRKYDEALAQRDAQAKASGEMTMEDRRRGALQLKIRLARLEGKLLDDPDSSSAYDWSKQSAWLEARIKKLENPLYRIEKSGELVDDSVVRSVAGELWRAQRRLQWDALDKPPGIQSREEFERQQDMIEPGRKGLLAPGQAGDIDPIDLIAQLGVGWVFKPPVPRPGPSQGPVPPKPPPEPPLLRAPDLEARADTVRKYLAGQDTRLGKQILKGKKNIAVGEVRLGEESYSLQAVSGQTDPEGFTKFVPNEERSLKAGGAGKYIRDVDSEAKILEQTMQMTNPESTGTIRIFTEKKPCDACNSSLTISTNTGPE